MGHIGEEGGLGIAGNLGGPQGFSQLAVVQLPFCLPFRHVNLADFYRANNIVDSTLQADVARCLEEGDRILFYHNLSLIEVVQNTTE